MGEGSVTRLGAHCAIVYFGMLFENNRNRPNVWATLFRGKGRVLILTKKMGLATFYLKFILSPRGKEKEAFSFCFKITLKIPLHMNINVACISKKKYYFTLGLTREGVKKG
jgi:hypothetical protein